MKHTEPHLMETRDIVIIVAWTVLITSLLWVSVLAPRPFDVIAAGVLVIGSLLRLRRFAHDRST